MSTPLRPSSPPFAALFELDANDSMPMIQRVGDIGRWFFTDPTTDRIVIAQRPNATLVAFIVAKAVELITTGSLASAAGWTATGLLVFWAGDEVIRGVNPWRRTLGAAVAVWQIWSRLA